jgi:hypothetical protein
MEREAVDTIPPLQGCLYCHSEGTMILSEGRKFLGMGGNYPVLRCTQCDSVALLDCAPDHWRIRYKHTNPAPSYYYVAIHLGKAGWLPSEAALAISTTGYIQRARVEQTQAGDLAWLQPAPLRPPPPLMSTEETVYLSLKGVTLQEAPPSGLLVRADQGGVLDTGKFYITDQKLHLLGQRRDWSHRLTDIHKVEYNTKSWAVVINTLGQPQQYRGLNLPDQYDAQLVAAVIEILRGQV